MSAPGRGRGQAELGCPFCIRVKRGEFGYSDEHNVAFQPLNPVTPGHFLVVPRRHVSSALEAPNDAGGALEFGGYLANQMGLVAANFITSAGRDATQSVFHLHVHIVPRRKGDGLVLPWTGQQIAAAAQKQPAPGPFPEGCTCLELEDSQRSADPDCPVHADDRGFWAWMDGYVDEPHNAQYEAADMQRAYEAGTSARESVTAAERDDLAAELDKLKGLLNRFTRSVIDYSPTLSIAQEARAVRGEAGLPVIDQFSQPEGQ